MISPALVSSAASVVSSLAAPLVQSTTQSQASTKAQSSSQASSKSNNVVTQSDFLNLLVQQLQNQDPLNPLDSANFTAQLAQFSSLDQLVQINQRLADTSQAGRFDAVSFLGREVTGVGSSMTVSGGTASGLDYNLAGQGDVKATIYDSSGSPVASLMLGSQTAGSHTFDLKSAPKAPKLADGTYKVNLSAVAADGTESPIETRIRGKVTGVDLSTDPPALLLGDTRLALADVRQVDEATQTK
jgi:flagellar basal-body rod modification protein FlgD